MNLEAYLKIKKELGSKISLVAVSKGQPKEKILKLYDKGHRDFGENFLQELTDKKTQLPNDIRWHFLGNIQSNKLSKIVEYADIIHSISRYKIYEILVNHLPKISTSILLQLKLGSEKTKSGFSNPIKRQKAWDSCKNNAKANYDRELIVKYFVQHGFNNPNNLNFKKSDN